MTKTDLPLKNRVLIVDDEQSILDVFVEWLKYYRYECEIATSGSIALSKFDYFHPDILITDLFMPKMDGFELIQRIREQKSREYPCLIISGHQESIKKFKKMNLNKIKLLMKPISYEEFIKNVRELLEA